MHWNRNAKILLIFLSLALFCAGSAAGQDLGQWTTKKVSVQSEADGQLREVRAARNQGFDRAVFEFADGVPEYMVGYVNPPILGDDDKPVHMSGKAFIEVRFRCYYGENDPEKIFKGYPQGKLNLPALLEIKDSYWFEALQIYALGARKQTPFRVQQLSSPARLVIDIKH